VKGNGLIIRLIDIVMILLLGFLNISDIIHKNEIKLPSKKKTTKNATNNQMLRLKVQIVPSDTTIDSLKTSSSHIKLSQQFIFYRVSEGDKSYRIRNLDQLEDKILRIKANYDSMLVIIKPDSNSIVQGTINLIDICRRYNLKRMFDYNYPGSN